jgi:hypothetical protein
MDAASVFGQLWKLEPFPAERRTIWRREWNGFSLSVITLWSLFLHCKLFQMVVLRRLGWLSWFFGPCSSIWLVHILEFCLATKLTIWKKVATMYHRVLVHILMATPCLMLQVMLSRPRSDVQLNLPALQKLENMLLVCAVTLEADRLFPVNLFLYWNMSQVLCFNFKPVIMVSTKLND